MNRIPAALLAAGLGLVLLASQVRAAADSSPFPVLPEPRPPSRAHTWAYAAMASGVALIGASFYFHERGDRAYDEYLTATDPAAIERLYDDSTRFDSISRGSLASGEALIAAGLYLRFVRRPAAARAAVLVGPTRCALAVHF